MFIVFEGGEGCGKSTQSQRLYEYLKSKGDKVVLTREPGGTRNAERIRELVVSPDNEEWPIMAEFLLMMAARVDHWAKFIKPHLDQGYTVICDRFMMSTLAYQGYGRGLDPQWLKDMHHKILPDVKIDKTFVFLLSPQHALGRVKTPQRFEALGVDFHTRVYEGFKEMSQEWDFIDIHGKSCDDVFEEIMMMLAPSRSLCG